MDRGSNLEALTEEEDEDVEDREDGASLNTSDSEDEPGDGGIRRGKTNKFDGLCDGVLQTMALLQTSLAELLELKDELMKHSLPPNVLMKLGLATTKIFRSASDMNMPVNELVRLVRIYSTPWEEKSAALKKLHEDYETKKSQLNIAVKRLQMIDAQAKRIERERRIMNWEKVFAQITSSRGHGRRWKFLIEAFKKKAKEGVESLQKYVDAIERDPDSEPEPDPEVEDDEVPTQMQQVAPPGEEHGDEQLQAEAGEEDKGEESDDEDSDGEDESKTFGTSEPSSEMTSPRKGEETEVTYIRPVMHDRETWTHEPEYERTLVIRVFEPEGLDAQDMRCVLRYGKQKVKTDLLDEPPLVESESEDKESEIIEEKPAPRGRGLIGTRGGRGNGRPRAARAGAGREDGPSRRRSHHIKFSQCSFEMPPEEPRGIWNPKSEQNPEHLKVTVHHGGMEDMIAMATIDMDDLHSLDLPSIFLPEPRGDDPLEEYTKQDTVDKSATNSTDKISQLASTSTIGSQGPIDDGTLPLSIADIDKQLPGEMEPVKFPLYSVQAGKGDGMHMPCGHLPLACFWLKRLKPLEFHRATDPVENVRDIVLDVTGYDMYEVTKEDLHKEMREECLSAVSFASEPKEEVVSQAKYDELMKIHEEEMLMLQQEYEERLQELAESMQQMQEGHLIAPPGVHSPRALSPSARSLRSRSPGVASDGMGDGYPHPPPIRVNAVQQTPSRRYVKVGQTMPNWGENLPKDFFERLQLFEEMSRRNRQELSNKMHKSVSETLEKQLAGQYKLTTQDADDPSNVMQDVSLPAVFMPTKKNGKLHIYNPRASKYFHPTGCSAARLTQPPSMVQLPPLPKNKLNVVNLFDLSRNFSHDGGGDSNAWLMQKYMDENQELGGQRGIDSPYTPPVPPPTHLAPGFATETTGIKTRENTVA